MCTTQIQKETKTPNHKETETKLMKGLLDYIILQLLNTQPMHGYQIIAQVRKSFGVHFGPSTIYLLLGTLEKKGCITSKWNTDSKRPRKVYKLAKEVQNLLDFTEDSLNIICKRLVAQVPIDLGMTVEPTGTIHH
jgi:PadR family transcriptional regulator PadR